MTNPGKKPLLAGKKRRGGYWIHLREHALMDSQPSKPVSEEPHCAESAESDHGLHLEDRVRAKLIRYARRLIGDRLVDGRGPAEFAELAIDKLARGERRVGSASVEV